MASNRATIPATPRRARSLAAIHAGKRQLGWDDESYRIFVEQITGKSSASLCTDDELGRVLDGMRERGYQRREGVAPGVTGERKTQLDKARRLWEELHAIGAVRHVGSVAFYAYIERMTRQSRPEWCTPAQLTVVIEGLKAWLERERKKADAFEADA